MSANFKFKSIQAVEVVKKYIDNRTKIMYNLFNEN